MILRLIIIQNKPLFYLYLKNSNNKDMQFNIKIFNFELNIEIYMYFLLEKNIKNIKYKKYYYEIKLSKIKFTYNYLLSTCS